MKKIYKKPALEVVKVRTQKMMAGSEVPVGEPGNASNAESRRRGSYWDDGDDSEDY